MLFSGPQVNSLYSFIESDPMKRKNFLKLMPIAGISPYLSVYSVEPEANETFTRDPDRDSRAYWVSVMQKLVGPVLQTLSAGKLKEKMPVEYTIQDRRNVTHLEAFGRTLAGIAPWLELGPDNSPEGALRNRYIEMTRNSISMAVDPSSPDFMNFTEERQPLVDAAFFAHGLLRGFNQLWLPLDNKVRGQVVDAMKSTRAIKPGNSNWLLFSAMVEAFLLKTGNDWNKGPVEYALQKHSEWYKGDGMYGDGPEFHWDYYNSFVIHPMLLDIIKVLKENGIETAIRYEQELNRARRYAAILERMISPEGTYPPVGRSLCYRFGAFQLLGQITLLGQLPETVSPAQVRSGLSAVISREMEAPGTFDENGWLTIGISGHQPGVSEGYISTGSLYLCTTGLLPLGLGEKDPFWTLPAADWTSKKIWKGIDVASDHAYHEE
jgi:hypothetical protein